MGGRRDAQRPRLHTDRFDHIWGGHVEFGRKMKGGALTGLTGDLDVSIHELGDLFDDHETKAASPEETRGCRVGLLILAEEALLGFSGNSRTRIGNTNTERAAVDLPGGDGANFHRN